jgi:predicted HicB family RNase H-like nuclease
MNKLPQFESLDELVEFWEIHDFTDYIDEMEEIDFDTLSSERVTLRITLAPEPLAKLTEMADQQGVTLNTLARTWIEERLKREAA